MADSTTRYVQGELFPPPGLCQCGCGKPTPLARYTSMRDGAVKGQPVRFLKNHSRRGRTVSAETQARISAGAMRAKESWSPCPVPDCTNRLRPDNTTGYCRTHSYKAKGRIPDAWRPCVQPGCSRRVLKRNVEGYCQSHAYLSPRARAWNAANRPKMRAAEKKYRDTHKEKRARTTYEASKKWKLRPDRPCRLKCGEFAMIGQTLCRKHDFERADRRRKAKRQRLNQRLYDRQRGMCPDADHGGCGLALPDDLKACEIDHLYPASRGGAHAERNYQLMHAYCNRSKRDNLVPAAVRDAARLRSDPSGGAKEAA